MDTDTVVVAGDSIRYRLVIAAVNLIGLTILSVAFLAALHLAAHLAALFVALVRLMGLY